MLGGVEIKKGERVMVLWGSANRDERVYAAPEVFDIFRGGEAPPKHYSFGSGIHLCLGNSLARREIRIVVEETLKRFESLTLDEGERVPYFYVPNTFTRCLERLCVKFVLKEKEVE